MAHVYPARTADTSLSTGLGNISVSGVAPEKSMRTFNGALSIGDSVYLGIAHRDANEWEEGLYTYVGVDRFVRTQILQSSASNGPVNFTAGIKDVWVTIPSLVVQQSDDSVTHSGRAIVDFGGSGSPDTSVVVSLDSIAATSLVMAQVLAVDSSDHTADEHWADAPIITAGEIVVDTSFTIRAVARAGNLTGKYNVSWIVK